MPQSQASEARLTCSGHPRRIPANDNQPFRHRRLTLVLRTAIAVRTLGGSGKEPAQAGTPSSAAYYRVVDTLASVSLTGCYTPDAAAAGWCAIVGLSPASIMCLQ